MMMRLRDRLPPDSLDRLRRLRHAVAAVLDAADSAQGRHVEAARTRRDAQLVCLEDWLFDDEQQQVLGLNPENIFLLHAGSVLLDLFVDRTHRAGADDDPGSALVARWDAFGFRSRREATAAADLCRTAADWPPAAEDAGYADPVAEAGNLNPGLVAAGLQLARALDLTDVSVGAALARLLPEGVALSPAALAQCFDVLACGPHRFLPGTIRIKVRCRHAEVHRALKHYETHLQQALNGLNRMVTPRFRFADCRFEIEPQGYDPVDLKFTVDSSAALKLFTGNRLYDDRRAFLRELLQNAVDACKLRQLADKDYRPAITIRFQDDIRIVSVRDNGIGMDRQWIEKYFLQIGISFYQTGRIRRIDRQGGIGLSFISQFGIGFLSSFLVAEKIVIRTRKAGAAGLMITIRDLKAYFDVRPLGSDTPVGTEVALHLRPSREKYCRSLEYVGYLKTNIRFLKVPVQLVDEDGGRTSIGREQLAYPDDGGRGTSFVAPLDLPASEGYLLLTARKQTSYIQGIEPAHGGVSVFQDGIFVTQVDSLLPEGARQHVIGRINLEGADKCELSMDRNRIFWGQEDLDRIKQAIRQALAEAVNRLVASVQTQDAPAAVQTSIINQLSIFFDFNEVDDAVYALLCPPIRTRVAKRFRDFVRIHFAHAIPSARRPAADGYNEAWQQAILEGFRKRRRG
jgi:hypothetical protein